MSYIVGDVVVDMAGNNPALVTKVHEYADQIVNNHFHAFAYTILDASGSYDYVKEQWLRPLSDEFVAGVFKAMVEELYLGKD